jgi:hypothetical protein
MLEAALVTRLAVVAPNMYPGIAPKDYATPAVVFNRIHTQPVRDLATPINDAWVVFQIDVYDADYLTAKTTAKAIRDALSGWSDEDVASCVWDNEQDLVDNTTEITQYRTMQTFLLFAAV